MRWPTLGTLLSLALHGGAAAAIAVMPRDVARKATTFTVAQKKKEQKKEDARPDEPPPPPPKPVEPPRKATPRPKAAPENTPPPPPTAAAKPAAAAHPVLDALPNLGISMAGGPGGVGLAVPAPAGEAPAAKAPEGRGPLPKPKDDSAEPLVKPKLQGAIAQDRIQAAAQAAGGVEGKIRLEIEVDEHGSVTAVRVTSGLGGAIDEAAVSAARRLRFTPGTRGGRNVAATFRITITVRNPD